VLAGALLKLIGKRRLAAGRAAMNAGADVGGAIGGIAYSKEQEREEDYLSAVILYRSGVDLDKARGFLVKLAKASGRTETGLLDTHPAGPERIAAWDRAVQGNPSRERRLAAAKVTSHAELLHECGAELKHALAGETLISITA
jgi:predicted Zn-dependent protease